MTTLAKAKLASSITFIVLASFTIVTYDRQNMFIIQATRHDHSKNNHLNAMSEWETINHKENEVSQVSITKISRVI